MGVFIGNTVVSVLIVLSTNVDTPLTNIIICTVSSLNHANKHVESDTIVPAVFLYWPNLDGFPTLQRYWGGNSSRGLRSQQLELWQMLGWNVKYFVGEILNYIYAIF